MIKLFKKKIDVNLYAPVSGKCIDITEVNDKVFSSKVMGDGFGIVPEGTVVCSPCEGKITMIFPTKHAFGVKMNDDKEILVHIGIDTVNLNGMGFKSFKKVNDIVKIGEPVIEVDRNLLLSNGYDLTTMVIVTENNNALIRDKKVGIEVKVKDRIVSY